MQSKKSSGVIDLRGGRSTSRPPKGQVPLFSPWGNKPRTPETPRRPMPLRAKRRRIRALVLLGVVLLLAALCYGVSWASYLPQFNISTIEISGTKEVKEDLVLRSVETVLDDGAFHILSRRNVLLYPRESLESTIVASFPPVKSAKITRPSLLATNLMVAVEEREPFARWCSSAQTGEARCYFMDESGFLFAPVADSAGTSTAQASPATFYVFGGDIASSSDPVGQWFVQAHLPGLFSLLRVLGQAGFTPLGADIENGQDIFIRLQDGFLLKASFGADVGTLVRNLELVLSSDSLQGKRAEIEYVDLRFGNRVYYKLKGQEEQGTQ